ncbi:MAG: NAD(P)/FAD-dependent oxidoreductase [Pseudomonadota bacterium]|nr:NAD(P)/FAD-dependent oxidoreductase [Pseudomonadota bacterium]
MGISTDSSRAASNDVSANNTLVIGGGPAGLTVAYQLTKQQQQCHVLEADAIYLGGIARSVVHQGYRCDIGGHRFFSKSKQVNDLWHEVLSADEFIVRQRKSRIYYGNKFYDYPLRPINALLNLGLLESFLAVWSYLVALLKPVPQPVNFEQFMTNRFGARLYRHFFKSYTEKVWGRKCTDISSDWAAQRIKDFSLLAALKEAFSLTKQNQRAVHATLVNSFHYPKLGCGMMWERMGERIVAQGGKVSLGKRVTSCCLAADGKWQLTAVSGECYHADHVVSSMAIKDLATVLRAQISDDLYRVMNSFTYRDFLVVCLIVDSGETFDDQWIYVHDPNLKVGRVQNFKSWSPDMIPATDRNLLGMEYFCNQGDECWQRSDTELIAVATLELQALGLAKQVYGGYVVRQLQAYPVYEGGYAEKLVFVRQELAETCPNLHLVGRNGMHRYNNQDHSMLSAIATAVNIMAGKQVHDPWAISEDRDYLEV